MVCRHLSAVDSATKLHTGRVQPARERTFAKGRSGSIPGIDRIGQHAAYCVEKLSGKEADFRGIG
jgi:hypothetical protein